MGKGLWFVAGVAVGYWALPKVIASTKKRG